ncbi:F-box/kelch-repeat protein [Raphanus sativus]|uniref:F-box/kelch-repeat protein At4g39753-like isoform X1 n=1 Tax=Raphanus sativus TaxID=3726 RepID=A0A6J0KKF8_RAPSA|nr:F-box/kelch-repeat protein At4g39753-like isoform X1 [Raphanus sativus]KAJ4880130.1 F-box/kelch-repeat protein [Raphanus sativus]
MLHSSVQAAASAVVEPPWKKRKPNPSPPSFLSLPDVIILNCLARVSKSYYPILSLVSKTFRSLILSIELNHARFHHKTQESLFSICIQLPDRPLPLWFTLWIQPDHIEKKKAKLVQVPSSYAPQEPLLVCTVGSDIYAFSQRYPPSLFMLVRNKESAIWRNDAPKMTVARVNPAACVLHGKIYVMGGCKENESPESWGEVFDTKTRTWEPLPDPGAELRFSSVIRKIQITQGKLYVRSNEEKDSVYDPETRKWDATAKAPVDAVRCMVRNIYYACRAKSFIWYDEECNVWKQVKGLSSLNKNYRSMIEAVEYCGKLLIIWYKFVQPRRREKTICCALVALEKRQNGQVWGKVEWSNGVLTVPSSYFFLRSSVILT